MRHKLLVLVTVAFLVLFAPEQASAAASSVPASGTFTVDVVQLSSAVPLGSAACLITATVTLSFHGKLEGGATGPITVVSKAACDQPPTAGDVFLARLTFRGTAAGQPATTPLVYAGQTAPTGHVSGTMITTRPAALLRVHAVAGVGGGYAGNLLGP